MLPSQVAIVKRFGLPKQTVSRWMTKWETATLNSRTGDGRRNVIRKVARSSETILSTPRQASKLTSPARGISCRVLSRNLRGLL